MKISYTWFWIFLGVISIFFHLWLVFSGLVPSLISRPIHMALAIPWIFLYTEKLNKPSYLNLTITVIGISICLFIALNESRLSEQYGFLNSNFQIFISVILLMITIEMARKAIGFALPSIAIIFIIYGLFGQYIPGEFGHAGIPLKSFLGTMTITEGGIWGKLTGISVSIVAIFVILGAILNAGEAGQGFMNFAIFSAGKLKAGAAKVAILSSAFFGSISGSASANVASTGMITLPAMIKLGYPKRIAAAVEAVSSTGGQIMPPLMGAGAFVMVELTGIPYQNIILAALIPAFLYFATVWIGINSYANIYKLLPFQDKDKPSFMIVFKTTLFFLIPFVTLLIILFSGFTPQFAASSAILIAFILLFIDINLKFDLRKFFTRVQTASIFAGKQIAMIASIILCASIIVGVLGITGLGIKITSMIISSSNGLLWPALIMTALACIVLGMEVPTTAAYVICVSVAGPALIDMGLKPLTVHLFVFWYALLSTITPPVCGGVFIASSMVQENWVKVSLTAMSLGLGLYIIPIAMVIHPSILNIIENPLVSILSGFQIVLALTAFSLSIISEKKIYIKIVFFIFGILLFLINFTEVLKHN